MECPLTVFRSQSTLEGVNKSINNSSTLYCQRAASRRREAAWRQPYKAVRGSSKAEWFSNRRNIKVSKNGQQKTCNLFCNIAAKRVELRCWAFQLPPMFKPVNNPICCKTGLMWVVKRATSLFNSFCNNVAKQVARFLLPVFPYL